MKITFYLSWIVFISLFIANYYVNYASDDIKKMIPYWMPNIFKIVQFLTYFMLAFVPMLHKYEGMENPKGINAIYLEALFVSFCFRSMLFIASFYKLDKRLDILIALGGLMLGYYIFDIRKKIKAIERTLL